MASEENIPSPDINNNNNNNNKQGDADVPTNPKAQENPPSWIESLGADVNSLCCIFHQHSEKIFFEGVGQFKRWVKSNEPYKQYPDALMSQIVDRIIRGEISREHGYYARYAVAEATSIPFAPVIQVDEGVGVASVLQAFSDFDGFLVSGFVRPDGQFERVSMLPSPVLTKMFVPQTENFILELMRPSTRICDISERKMPMTLMIHELFRMNFVEIFHKSRRGSGSMPKLREWLTISSELLKEVYPKKDVVIDFIYQSVVGASRVDLDREMTLIQFVDIFGYHFTRMKSTNVPLFTRLIRLEIALAEEMRRMYELLSAKNAIMSTATDFLGDLESAHNRLDFRSRTALVKKLTSRAEMESKEEEEMKEKVEKLTSATTQITSRLGSRRRSEPQEHVRGMVMELATLIVRGNIDVENPVFDSLRKLLQSDGGSTAESEASSSRARGRRHSEVVQQGQGFTAGTAAFSSEQQELTFGDSHRMSYLPHRGRGGWRGRRGRGRGQPRRRRRFVEVDEDRFDEEEDLF